MNNRTITLFHAPQTRSLGTLILLEELGAPYELTVLDRNKDENRAPAYLAINPMGKVPALRDGEAIVTEQVAIYLHLADRFPEVGLAPPIGDPLRGPYLRWMVFYAACFEPAMVDRALNRDPGGRSLSPYGDYDTVVQTVAGALAEGPHLLGERFTAADLLWGTALGYFMQGKLLPERQEFLDYVRRIGERPAVVRACAKDQALAAAKG